MKDIEKTINEIEQIVKQSKDDKTLSTERHTEVLEKITEIAGVIQEGVQVEQEVLKSLAVLLKELPDNIKQDTIKVSNIPNEVKVGNLDEIIIPQSIDINRPDWIDELKSDEINDIYTLLGVLRKEGLDVNVTNISPKKPLAVRLTDGRNFYKAISTAVASGSMASFRDVNDSNKRALVDADGHVQVDVVTSPETNYATQLDDTSTANVTYVGTAVIGSITSGSVWRIRRLDETSGMVITWADGDDSFNNIWDDRTSLSYS